MVSSKRRLVTVAALLMAGAPALAAQDPLQRIKDLYASAAYEDALSAVSNLGSDEPKPEVAQYRVFSLVALGRLADAERAVEAVLTRHPRYRPDPAETSPRIQELFSAVRARVGPGAVKALYISGKAALDKKDREGAIAAFDEMLRTADDPDIKDQASVGELRLLGAGFLELSRALPGPAPLAATSPAATAATGSPEAVPPGSAPAITGPIAIRENLPRWVPSSSSSASSRIEFSGKLRVLITATGAVERAEIVESVHPAYDQLLLEAARNWLYQPARRNGVALPSEKTVAVQLKPSGKQP
jgi:TonB family protein